MMPLGKYYIGDLCYVMSDEEWEQVCRITIVGNKDRKSTRLNSSH